MFYLLLLSCLIFSSFASFSQTKCRPAAPDCGIQPINDFDETLVSLFPTTSTLKIEFSIKNQAGFVYPFVGNSPPDRTLVTMDGTPPSGLFDSIPLYDVNSQLSIFEPGKCPDSTYANDRYSCEIVESGWSSKCDSRFVTFEVSLAELKDSSVSGCSVSPVGYSSERLSSISCRLHACAAYYSCVPGTFFGATCDAMDFDIVVSEKNEPEKKGIDVIAQSAVTWVHEDGFARGIVDVALPQDKKIRHVFPTGCPKFDPIDFGKYVYSKCVEVGVDDGADVSQHCEIGIKSKKRVTHSRVSGSALLYVIINHFPHLEKLWIPYSLKNIVVETDLKTPGNVFVGPSLSQIATSEKPLIVPNNEFFVVVSWPKNSRKDYVLVNAEMPEMFVTRAWNESDMTRLMLGTEYTSVNLTDDAATLAVLDRDIPQDDLFEIFRLQVDGSRVGFGVGDEVTIVVNADVGKLKTSLRAPEVSIRADDSVISIYADGQRILRSGSGAWDSRGAARQRSLSFLGNDDDLVTDVVQMGLGQSFTIPGSPQTSFWMIVGIASGSSALVLTLCILGVCVSVLALCLCLRRRRSQQESSEQGEMRSLLQS